MAKNDNWTRMFDPFAFPDLPDGKVIGDIAAEESILARNDSARTNEDTLIRIDLTQNDEGIETGTVTILELNGATVSLGDTLQLAGGGLVTFNGDGVVTFDPNGAYEYLNRGESTVESFRYSISNGNETSTASVRVIVGGVNDGPVARNDIARTNEDSPVLIDLLENDLGVLGHTVTITMIDGATAFAGDTIKLDDGGLVTLRGDGVVAFDPNDAYEHLNAGQSALESFRYTISDGVNTSSATARVLIGGVNDGPVARNDLARTTEDSLVLIDLMDNDVMAATSTVTINLIDGVTVSPGDTVKLADGGVVTLRGGGIVAFDPSGAYEDLGRGESALESFRYSISDGVNSSTATARILIGGVNDAAPSATDSQTLTAFTGFSTDGFGF